MAASSSGGRKGAPLKLPRLHLKAELLQEVPELASLLSTATDAGPPNRAAAAAAALKAQQRAPSGLPGLSANRDTRAARIFKAEERTEEDELREELAEVKAERARLLASLTKLKRETAKAGAELQQQDIRHLRKDVELKQQKLNELKQEADATEKELGQLVLTSGDCAKLMPDGSPAEAARAAELEAHLKALDVEQAEAEAKHRLYTLLFERTRRDHGELELKVRAAHNKREAAVEDVTALTDEMHVERAAREDAERQLAADKALVENMRADWQRKLQERRKEVQAVERGQEEQKTKVDDKQAESERAGAAAKEKAARLKAANNAKQAQVAALQPKLDALKNQWALLEKVAGASTAEELIKFWQGLEKRIETMTQLREVVEQKEADYKQELAALQAEQFRLNAFPGQEVDTQPIADSETLAQHTTAVAQAKERKSVADKEFLKLEHFVINAHMGIRAMATRLDKVEPRDGSGRRRTSRPSSGTSVQQLSAVHLLDPAALEQRRGSMLQQQESPDTDAAAGMLSAMVAECSSMLQGIANRLPPLLESEQAWAKQHEAKSKASCTIMQEQLPPSVNEADAELGFMRGFRRASVAPMWPPNLRSQQVAAEGRVAVPDTAPAGDFGPNSMPDYWSSESSEDAGAKSGNESGAESDGDQDLLMDREYIKNRAVKLVAKQKALDANKPQERKPPPLPQMGLTSMPSPRGH